MAFQHGKDTVLVGGDVALTGDFSNSQITGEVQVVDVTTYGNDDEVFLAGLGKGALVMGGLFNDAANRSDAELNAALGASDGKLVTVGYGGLTIGNRLSMIQGRINSYNVQNSVTDAVRVSSTWTADGGIRNGVSLHDLTAETVAADFASVDQTASTAFGATAFLHVTAFTGTDVLIRVQDSADDSTWADLITFSSVTGITQQRSTTTGTVERYLRAQVVSGTFTSVTFTIGISRNYR